MDNSGKGTPRISSNPMPAPRSTPASRPITPSGPSRLTSPARGGVPHIPTISNQPMTIPQRPALAGTESARRLARPGSVRPPSVGRAPETPEFEKGSSYRAPQGRYILGRGTRHGVSERELNKAMLTVNRVAKLYIKPHDLRKLRKELHWQIEHHAARYNRPIGQFMDAGEIRDLIEHARHAYRLTHGSGALRLKSQEGIQKLEKNIREPD